MQSRADGAEATHMELNKKSLHDNGMKLHANNEATTSPCNLQLTKPKQYMWN